jgi:hypothetical protein
MKNENFLIHPSKAMSWPPFVFTSYHLKAEIQAFVSEKSKRKDG